MKTSRLGALVAVSAAFLLTGCLRVEMNVTLQEDDTADGDVVMAVAAGTGESLGATDEDIVEQLFGDVESDYPGAEVADYSEDEYVGKRVTFTGTPLSDMSFAGQNLTVTRDGDEYVVEGTYADPTGGDFDSLPETATMTLAVTFPGAISSSNGTVDGTTVTWDLTDAPATLEARGGASASSGPSMWLIIVIGLGIGIAAGVALVAAGRRRAPASTEGSPSEHADADNVGGAGPDAPPPASHRP